MQTFYNQKGRPIAYIDEDEESVYTFMGKPVAWISDGGLYAYSGQFLGWFDRGWIRDRYGRAVFFTEESMGGGLVRPVRQVRPVRSVKQVRPVRGVREVRPVRPVRQLAWSDLSDEQFFD